MGNLNWIDENIGKDIDEKDAAQFINDFFVNIGPNLAKKCDQPWSFNGISCAQNIENIRTNLDEIIKLCKEINIKKSSCIDHISSEILLDVFLAVPEKLMGLFNLSFVLSKIPGDWKIAKVTPLPKA